MLNPNKIFLIVIFNTLTLFLKSQPGVFQPGDYKDGVYDKENATNRRYIPYTHLREADVTWEKRVWRRIDMRERQNQTLYFPKTYINGRMSFLQMILKYILKGDVIAFQDEEFQQPFELSEIRKKVVYQPTDSIDEVGIDEQGNEITTKKLPPADSLWMFDNFTSIELKEDWFFDKQKSSLDVRILGMTFNFRPRGKDDAGEVAYFYLYFPACRPYFAKHEVFNVKNDSERRTFEDVFWKRQFSSIATKESNLYNRTVDDYSKGIDALLESDRIKYDIFKYEHDMWHF